MPSIGDDVDLLELLLLLGVAAVIIYYVHNWFTSATCIAKIGAIPGVTGATQGQVVAATVAADNLKPGGKVIWSCGSDFDFQQPCGDVVQARHNFLDYVPILNIWQNPVKYTTVSKNVYVVPTKGTVAPGLCCCYQHDCEICTNGMFQAGAGGA